MLFMRFIFCLGVGLIGLSMVLMTVLETVLSDWDASADINRILNPRRYLLKGFFNDEDGEDEEAGRMNAYGRQSKAPARRSEREPAEV